MHGQKHIVRPNEFVYYVTRSMNGPSSAVKEIMGFLGISC